MTTTPTESMVSLPVAGADLDHFDPKYMHDACEPSPRVLQRRADDVAYRAPETLIERLRAVGYREPILPRTCAVEGCANLTHGTVCHECEEAIAQDALDLFGAAVLTAALAVGLCK